MGWVMMVVILSRVWKEESHVFFPVGFGGSQEHVRIIDAKVTRQPWILRYSRYFVWEE
jgi:hypothetical protein